MLGGVDRIRFAVLKRKNSPRHGVYFSNLRKKALLLGFYSVIIVIN